jgi:hypothetical protein
LKGILSGQSNFRVRVRVIVRIRIRIIKYVVIIAKMTKRFLESNRFDQ